MKNTKACIDYYYQRLGNDNDEELRLMAKMFWDNQAYQAFLGPLLISAGFIIGWTILIAPEMKPDIS